MPRGINHHKALIVSGLRKYNNLSPGRPIRFTVSTPDSNRAFSYRWLRGEMAFGAAGRLYRRELVGQGASPVPLGASPGVPKSARAGRNSPNRESSLRRFQRARRPLGQARRLSYPNSTALRLTQFMFFGPNTFAGFVETELSRLVGADEFNVSFLRHFEVHSPVAGFQQARRLSYRTQQHYG